MTNVLPETEQKRVRREYTARFVLAGSLVAIATGAVVLLTLLPAWITMQIQRGVLEKATTAQATPPAQMEQDRAAITRAQSLMITLRPIAAASTTALEAIRSAIDDRPKGTRISSITYLVNAHTITLSGQAADNAGVAAYRTALQEDKHFTQVAVPVDVLVGADRSGRFIMTLSGSF